ncbi:unnamed protein product [Chondrus crispus]|uniref:Uncharacterized protein n=1 Tax=Chondrus crispus TaxID=2769 RepID=R7QM79_CHOCR|nr:unnamed protein product [Chondrus crispus]CDF38883.1 unnamed protein product [Chondrus crispus]|eukprot:XP_005718788.1 unnamed protein product [Chondrus crispus]
MTGARESGAGWSQTNILSKAATLDCGIRGHTPISSKKALDEGLIVEVLRDRDGHSRVQGGSGSTSMTLMPFARGCEDRAVANELPTRPPPMTRISTSLIFAGTLPYCTRENGVAASDLERCQGSEAERCDTLAESCSVAYRTTTLTFNGDSKCWIK